MRKLTVFTTGFAAACAYCAYLLPDKPWIWILGSILLTSLSSVYGRKTPLFRRTALAFLGCTLGFTWFWQFNVRYLYAPVSLDGEIRTVTIRAADYSYETNYGIGVDGTIILDGNSYQVRAYLDEREPLAPGDNIHGYFRFRVTTAHGAEEATYHPGDGIFLLAYQKDAVTVSAGSQTFRDYPAKLRRQIKVILQDCFPEDTYAFAKALLLGDTADLDYKTDTDLKVSGIRHVVAVSGLHVSILFALITAVTFHKRYLTALLGFPMLFLFAAVAGFTPSVTRACIMSGLLLLALLCNREYDGPTALSFAVLVMLILNPMVITSVGFQLSVASVAGIFLCNAPIRQWLLQLFGDLKQSGYKAFFARWAATSVSITVSAMLLTTPLCAWYFGMVSLVGVFTNLLTLWVISFLFYGLILICILYRFWTSCAVLLANLLSIPIRYILLTAGIMADIPIAAVYTCCPYITAWLIFVYVLLGLFLLNRGKNPVTLVCCITIGLCVSLIAGWTEPLLSATRVTMLDVGQGQCILLQNEGRTCMIDCGGDRDSETADLAASTLLSQGIARLDALILTHNDFDHAGAVNNLLTRIDADMLLLPEISSDLQLPTATTVVCVEKNMALSWNRTELSVFPATFPGTNNEKSLCILFDTEKCDILITGDRNGFGERMLLRRAAIPEVDVLIAGHHGSRNSTCEELLQAVRPKMVCISAGLDNPYGHPAPELLQRLQNHGCTVYRTDLNGTILIRR